MRCNRFAMRSEEHTSELQSPCNLVCRLLLEKKIRSEEHTSELQSPCNLVCRLLLVKNKRDFYTTVDGNGAPNDSVERMLASLEGAVWPVRDRRDQRGNELNEEDRAHVALVVAFMRTRTPAFEQMSSNLTNVTFQWLAKARNPTPEAVAEDYARATGKSIDMDEAQKIFDAIHS